MRERVRERVRERGKCWIMQLHRHLVRPEVRVLREKRQAEAQR